MTTENAHDTGNNALTLGFSLLAGLGLTLMMAGFAVGVIDGNSDTFGLLFFLGLAAFVGGLGAWLAVVQPWTHFDDINEPMYHGHVHHEGIDDHAPVDEQPGEINVGEQVPPQTT